MCEDLCTAAELHVDVEASPFGKRDNNGKKEDTSRQRMISDM